MRQKNFSPEFLDFMCQREDNDGEVLDRKNLSFRVTRSMRRKIDRAVAQGNEPNRQVLIRTALKEYFEKRELP